MSLLSTSEIFRRVSSAQRRPAAWRVINRSGSIDQTLLKKIGPPGTYIVILIRSGVNEGCEV